MVKNEMSQEERYGTRDGSYSAWHRRGSAGRFVGIERAQSLAMIDLDCCPYVEYDDFSKEPLALIETAVDVGQTYKPATVTRNLARMCGLPAYTVLYSLSSGANPADQRVRDILGFRVKRIWPIPESVWMSMSPSEWANELLRIRDRQTEKIDKAMFPELFRSTT